MRYFLLLFLKFRYLVDITQIIIPIYNLKTKYAVRKQIYIICKSISLNFTPVTTK